MIEINLYNRTITHADERTAFFFIADLSSVDAKGYDRRVLSPDNPPNTITGDDITCVNTTMMARTPRHAWKPFIDSKDTLSWLTALDPSWDLLEMDDGAWSGSGCEGRLEAAFKALMGPFRTTAVTTKVLALKRPKLIPICDSFVSDMVGGKPGDYHAKTDLILEVRKVGRDNLAALQEIDGRLRTIGIKRTLVRILDGLLWSEYMDAGRYAEFGKWLIQYRSGRLFFSATMVLPPQPLRDTHR